MSESEMPVDVKPSGADPLKLPADVLKRLMSRNNTLAWTRLAIHVAVLLVTSWVWLSWWYPSLFPPGMPGWLAWTAGIVNGFAVATMFACMHETVHRTAFRTKALNDGVAWGAGLLAFYNSTFYRHYHGWHHRFTNQTGKDPELSDPKPVSVLGYIIEISAVTWWWSKVMLYVFLVLGKTEGHPYISPDVRGEVVRSARFQVGVYVLLISLSVIFQSWLFVIAWFLPLVMGQPFLRMIVLSEHTGCERSANPYANTRTTMTIPFIHTLMWNMPLHAEHHRYPAVPFYHLAELHTYLRPHLTHVETCGYAEVQRGIIRRLGIDPA